MKKIMSLAIIALAAVAMVSCCGQPKKKTGACGEPCCQPQVECQQCPAKAECPKQAEEAKPACPAEKCAECPKKAECKKQVEEVKPACPAEKCAECPKTNCTKGKAEAKPALEAKPELKGLK